MRYPSHRTSLLAVSLGALGLAAACGKSPPPADTIYFGGPILTMAGDTPQYVEAIAVKAGKIAAVGSRAEATAMQGDATRMIDLQGKVLMPGFIDAHGHASNAGFQKLVANLLPPPDGEGRDVVSLVRLLKEWQGRNASAIAMLGWIVGFGYDDSQLAEKRHPTAADLDQVSTELPILIIHQSGHLASMNHKGLALAGYDAATADPTGGAVRREADGKTPNGVLEEMAVFGPLVKIFGALDSEANERLALAGVEAYTQFGFTTAQEGRASKQATETWRKLASEGKLRIDVASYPDIQAESEYMKQVGTSPAYTNRFRVAGVKLCPSGRRDRQKGRRAFSFTSFMTKKVRVCLTPGRAISFCPCSLLKSAISRTRIFSR